MTRSTSAGPGDSAATSCLWRVVLLGVLALLLSTCSQSPEVKKQRALERATGYMQAGKLNEAIIELRIALQVDPEFAPAVHALGRAYGRKSWYVDAWRELSRAQKRVPDSVPIAVDLGKVLLELDAWDEAEEQVELILTRDPRNREAVTIRAGALLGRGKPKEALALLESIPPRTDAEADRIRADILLKAGKLDEAEAAYRAVLAIRPDELKTLLGLAAISVERKQPEVASQFYKRAKAGNPYDPRPSLGLASTMAQQGHVEDAIKELEQVDPRAWTVGGMLALGQYYLQAKRPTEAVKLLDPVVGRLPKLAQARYLLGTALALSGDSSAVGQFEELDRQLLNDPLVRLRLASLYTQHGRPREALEKLRTVAKPSEKLPAYHLERGRALALLGRLDDALVAGRAAQRLAPEMPAPYLLMGQVHVQRGNLKAAEEMFARAIAVDAAYVPAYLAAGQLHLAAKDVKSALQDFDEAVKADPNSLAAIGAKAAALVQQNRLKDALAFVEQAGKQGTPEPGLYSLLGNLYITDGQTDKAAASFRRALETDPRSLAARFGLARIAMAQRKDEDAVVQLQEAVKAHPASITPVLLLRSLYERLGRPALAIPVLEEAVKADPRQLAFVAALSEVYASVGRYEDALGRASEALARQPDFVGARLVRGQVYLAKGNPEAALRDFQDAVRSSPGTAAAHLYLARAYGLVGRKTEAEAQYREALRLEPTAARTKLEVATQRGGKQDEQLRREAFDQLRQAIKDDPKNVIPRQALVRGYLDSGRTREAEEALKQLLDLAPALAEPNYLMAQILLAQRKEDAAVEYLRVALRGNPAHVGANVLLGRYLASKGQREQAMQPLETALSVNPNVPGAKFLLANLYLQSRRIPEALALARDLERANPNAVAPLLLLGALHIAERNPRAAVEVFEKSLKMNADSLEAHRGLGSAYVMLGQYDRAAESYRRALKLGGEDVISLNDLAWILSEFLNRPDEALPLAVKAQRLAPQSGSVLDTLGWIQFRRQSYTEAEKLLVQATERSPANGTAQYHLGMTYAKLGRKNDAASAWRRAASLDPKLAEREKIEQLIKGLD